jgi:N-acetylglucosaminyldiphosphoundecaprenol N-acetyl-beta-D-mannosaminyltransferase
VAARGADAVRARWAGVRISTADGFFDVGGAENARLIERINREAPDVIFVGMGMPRQEQWILRNYDWLKRGVVFPVGAAFDYEAGAARTPPRWTGPLGLEWLFRFAAEPRRLFARYFVEPWVLLPAFVADARAALKPA